MGKVSVYVPDRLLELAKAANLNFSGTLNRGLAAQLRALREAEPEPAEPAPASN